MYNKTKPVVLYIHGFESSPTPVKTSALADLGYTVVTAQIHYKENKGTFKRLRSLIDFFQVDWIIGSSLGGYTAFWLSQIYQIPTLLFNPALPFRKIDPGLIPKNIEYKQFQHVIFLGMQDDTVDPKITKSWIKSNFSNNQIHFIEHPTNGHQISLPVFKEIIAQASEILDITIHKNQLLEASSS